MSNKKTQLGGETSKGNENVPLPAATAVHFTAGQQKSENMVSNRTGETSGGSDEIVCDVQLTSINDIHEIDPVPASPSTPCSRIATKSLAGLLLRKREPKLWSTPSSYNGSYEINKEIDRSTFVTSAEPPSFLSGLYETREGQIESDEEINSWNLSYTIDITEEEVKSYITSSVKDELKSLDDALAKKACQQKIEKIPVILSENTHFKKYYKPRMVSIGPYHHGSPNLNMMERMKLKIAIQFIRNHRLSEEVLYSKIKREIKVLGEFYEEETVSGFDDDKLAWMFLLDGCTVLHYICCATKKDKDKVDQFEIWNVKADRLTFVKHDLFLLENQLPYRVIKLVISCLSNINEMRKSIEEFIFSTINAQWENHEKLDHQQWQNSDPQHLLDLLRTRILQSVEKSPMSCSIAQQPIKNVVEIMSQPLEKTKDLIEYICKALENFPRKQTQNLQFFRNVEELKAAGIRLKPNNTGGLTDITFNLGTLKIHPIKVDDTTASMFLNLIAYEMSPDFSNNFGFSSYIAFLDALIDQTQDVKELRDRQILRNVLGSDEEVVKLFNEISTNLVPHPQKYSNVKTDIQKRYNNKWMTWIAQFYHQYFQNPWTVIAFIAAIVILVLTVIQTVYTTLGYYQ